MNKLTIIPAILFATILIFTSCNKEDENEDIKAPLSPKCELTIEGGKTEFSYGDTINIHLLVVHTYAKVKSVELILNKDVIQQSTKRDYIYRLNTGKLKAGDYTVTMKVTDENDSTGTDEKMFTVISGTPSIETLEVLQIGADSATVQGRFKSSGGLPVTWGVCFNTSGKPTKDENKLEVTDSIFNVKLTGLERVTKYFVRTWAQSESGTSYGEEVVFKTTNEIGVFFDARDNHKYRWVKIGDQTWMAENLAYLPYVIPNSSLSESDTDIYVAKYEGIDVLSAKQQDNYKIYGALYSWKMASQMCPSGWHLPDTNEWKELANYLGGEKIAGGKLKSKGTEFWDEPNKGATNESGFDAKPGGLSGKYIGVYAQFWHGNDASPSWPEDNSFIGLGTSSEAIGINISSLSKKAALSVRCVRDK